MRFEDLVKSRSAWLTGGGPEGEIVMSSRIRLARNLADKTFPNRATLTEKKEFLKGMVVALKRIPRFQKGIVLKMNELSEIDRQFLVERNLISRELAVSGEGSAVAIDREQEVSVMINEEDHLRMQVLLSGFRLEECWDMVSSVDDDLSRELNYAFSSRLGYLTACPTNVGTGMRVSVMMHLPALILIKQIDQVTQAIVKLGLAVRGFYGEGTEVFVSMFQISNQVTLGKSESEIMSSLKKVITQVVRSEKNARKALLKSNAEVLHDKIGRAYGILTNAHLVTSREAIDLLSTLRIGVDLDIVGAIDRNAINELFILTQPAHLQKLKGCELDPNARDIERGSLLRNKLSRNNR